MDGKYTPTYLGLTTPGRNRYEATAGSFIVKDGIVHIRGTVYNRSIDRAMRTLNRLRYPPKAPAHGSTSRRREKLRKAGLRR